MNLEYYFTTLKDDYPNIKLPNIVAAEDFSESQLYINGKWTNYVYGCGVINKNNKFVYVETDQERGYISIIKEFETQQMLEQYIINRFTVIANASKEVNSKEEMAVRFIQQKYRYSAKQSRKMVDQIAKHKDIFEEFFNYIRVNKLCKKDGTQVSICGYTAERLIYEKDLSVLGAYNFLTYLLEEPEEALNDLGKMHPSK